MYLMPMIGPKVFINFVSKSTHLYWSIIYWSIITTNQIKKVLKCKLCQVSARTFLPS